MRHPALGSLRRQGLASTVPRPRSFRSPRASIGPGTGPPAPVAERRCRTTTRARPRSGAGRPRSGPVHPSPRRRGAADALHIFPDMAPCARAGAPRRVPGGRERQHVHPDKGRSTRRRSIYPVREGGLPRLKKIEAPRGARFGHRPSDAGGRPSAGAASPRRRPSRPSAPDPRAHPTPFGEDSMGVAFAGAGPILCAPDRRPPPPRPTVLRPTPSAARAPARICRRPRPRIGPRLPQKSARPGGRHAAGRRAGPRHWLAIDLISCSCSFSTGSVSVAKLFSGPSSPALAKLSKSSTAFSWPCTCAST